MVEYTGRICTDPHGYTTDGVEAELSDGVCTLSTDFHICELRVEAVSGLKVDVEWVTDVVCWVPCDGLRLWTGHDKC